MHIGFTQGFYLWLLLLFPVVILLTLAAVNHSRKLNSFFFEVKPQSKTLRYFALVALAMFTYCNLVLALSEPQLTKLQARSIHENVRVAVGIDISKSMLAEDVAFDSKPEPAFPTSNRLNLARKFAIQLIGRMQREKAGIFFFADKGVEMVPLTRDYGFINYILKYTGTRQMAIPGSNLVNALQTGSRMLKKEAENLLNIIIISDGEDTQNDLSTLKDTLSSINTKNFNISCVGVGTKENTLIPIKYDSKIEDYYRDQKGEYLQTNLNENFLRLISSKGSYYHLSGNNYKDISEDIHNDILKLEKSSIKELSSRTKEKSTINLKPFFILASLAMFTGYFLIWA